MPLMDDASAMAQAAYGRLQNLASTPFSPMLDNQNPQTQPNATVPPITPMMDPGGGGAPTPTPTSAPQPGMGPGGNAYGSADVDKASQYLISLFNALQGQAHGILNAWNTEGDAGARASDPFFQAAFKAAGPGPFQNGGLNPALKNDPAFKKAVWDAIAGQVGGGNNIFGHYLAGVLGQGQVGGYDIARGWPGAGGAYSGDPGLKAGGFDPAHLPDWYRKAVARATGVA